MNENGKSKLGSVIGTVVLAATCAVGGWLGCGIWSDIAAAKIRQRMAAMGSGHHLAQVAITNGIKRTYNLPQKFVAHAEAMQEVELLPQVDGYIREIKFKEGDVVKAGDLLYVLDDEKYQAIVNQGKADLNAAEAEYRRAQRYYDRMKNADERGITQLERDNAQAAADKGNAVVMQAKANLVVAEYNCKKAKVYAPISGQIGKSNVHVGDYVAPSKGALARIVQIDPIRVSFPVTDRAYVNWRLAVKQGRAPDLRMRLLLPNGAEYNQQGTWDFDDNEMSKETATIVMRLSFANPDRLLIPGSYVTLLTDFVKPPEYLSLPQQCFIELSGGSRGIWIVKDDLTVEQRVVETKEAFEGWNPVVSGLKEGEKVVLSGVGKLATGMKVEVKTPTGNDDIVKGYEPPIKD